MKYTALFTALTLTATLAPTLRAQSSRAAVEAEAFDMLLAGPGSAIGIRSRDVPPADAARLLTESGAIVEQIYEGSPAQTAGLQVSDVIVEFDGERVRSAKQLSRLVQETPPGRTVKIVVMREGRTTDLSITPERDRSRGGRWTAGVRVEPPPAPPNPEPSPWRRGQVGPLEWEFMRSRARLGATVQEMTPQLSEFFGAKQGVLVSSVLDNSPASRAGLRVGDVITAVNGQAVDARDDLAETLSNAKDGDTLTLTIVRNKKESSLTAKVERWEARRDSLD